MKDVLKLIIDAAKNDDMHRIIELVEKQQDKFCDNNCVWTDHHPNCVRAKPEWYHGIDAHGCNRFYHKDEVRPFECNTPLYTHPPQSNARGHSPQHSEDAKQPKREPLTDDDLSDIADVATRTGNLYDLRLVIEAKLRDKNT